jgi:ABC-type multidrug transport system ATPase subunit
MRPIRYGQWLRWADAYQGWQDGRAGIPGRPPLPGPVTTGHREALIRQAQDAFAFEYLRYSEQVADPHRRIMAEQARLDAASSALSWAESALDMETGALTEPERKRRRLGEEHHPDTVIVARRRREHEKLLRRARASVATARTGRAAVEASLAETREEARQLHLAAVARVERIHEHIHRRLAVYRRSMIRAHDDAAWANAALSVRAPEMPSWALPDAYLPESISLPPQEPDPPDSGTDEPEPDTCVEIKLDYDVTRVGSFAPASGGAKDGIGYITIDSEVAAPWHFTIEKKDGRLRLTTRGHAHGPYVDGQAIDAAILGKNDYFDFADYRFTVVDASQLKQERLGKCDLIAVELSAKSGAKIRLADMSFAQPEKTLLAVLGPSGAGKTSLFNTLLGELPLQSGRLYFQGLSMETHARQIRERLGFVPQGTKLHDTLTVASTLRYGYRLRSLQGKGKGQHAVDRVLKQVDLEKQRDQLLSTLSGGQLRRVSIALELLTDPPLLLLDEPTTGLDAHMDREIMTLLRSHAEQDHTVIVVTHATEHLSFAHQILVVVENGTPAYLGPPRQIRKHFGFRMYADLMHKLQTEHEHWAGLYRGGREAREADRQARELERLIASQGQSAAGPEATLRRHTPRSSLRAFSTLFSRQWLLLLSRARTRDKADRTFVRTVMNAATVSMPLLVAAGAAALAAEVVGAPGLGAKPSDAGSTSLALLTTLCVLSAQALTYSDVVGDLEIIQREYRVGVGALPVLSAKWLVYAVVAVAQAGLITAIFCAFPNLGPQRFVELGPEADLFIGLAVLSVSAMTLGLLVSSMAAKLEHAVAMVTLASIAQITLNGITSSLASFSGISVVAAVLPDRWGVAATASSVDLRGIEDLPSLGVPRDALWQHTSGHWIVDLGAMIGLSAIFFWLAVWRLSLRLRPKTRHDHFRLSKRSFPTFRPRKLAGTSSRAKVTDAPATAAGSAR